LQQPQQQSEQLLLQQPEQLLSDRRAVVKGTGIMRHERARAIGRAAGSIVASASLVATLAFGIFNPGRFDRFPVETASAGNGGVATADANGGVVSVGDVNSGANRGKSITVGFPT
jgi:hypothetical protein